MASTFNRRTVIAGAGLLLANSAVGATSERKTLTLELVEGELELKRGQPTPTWRFAGDVVPKFDQGDEVEITIANRLPVGVLIAWRGLPGASEVEPALARGPIAPGGSGRYLLTLRQAGTLVCDARLGGGGRPLPLLPLIVQERPPISVDRDDVLLIEDWRVAGDGRLLPPGIDATSATTVLTINGSPAFDTSVRRNERLRLRIINGAQRAVIALQFESLVVQVIAIDSKPAEPFLARDGRLLMAPGTRIDVLIDAVAAGTFPIAISDGETTSTVGSILGSQEAARSLPLAPPEALPPNGLPAQLRLQSALRIDLLLGADGGWIAPLDLNSATRPAFRVKRGRVAVLALINPLDRTAIFHLHGHPMRLLDHLDDGWKPFWLDTIAVPGNQTARVAFEATYPGAYLMEVTGTEWASPMRAKSYFVDV